nr:MAG TPA_asm: hypothetical protein [Caudoviricetes sp.]
MSMKIFSYEKFCKFAYEKKIFCAKIVFINKEMEFLCRRILRNYYFLQPLCVA